jgi:multisubunit Na+/H+ antiporter MnhG subunit
VTTWIKLFFALGAFLVVVATVYWFLAYENAGTVLLLGAAIMAVTVGAYLLVAARGTDPAPADRDDVEARDVAGTFVGSFPLSSAWPVVFAIGLLFVAMGLVYALILLPVGLITSMIAVIGLMRESDS